MTVFHTSLSLDEQALAFNRLTIAYALEALLERTLRNLGFISTSSQTEPLPFVNANLFQLAGFYYKDSTLWTIIRDANNLTDFIVPGESSLIIPPNPNINPNNNTTVTS